jgi:Protein of unknown function (DUF3037)
MPEPHLFEYAVIRAVPLVEREEFLNVGVILYCPKEKFLKLKFMLDESRLKALNSQLDIRELHEHLASFERICAGDKGPIGGLPLPERFRWLTAARSTIVQTSKVHPGLCQEAGEMLDRLFRQLVMIEGSDGEIHPSA